MGRLKEGVATASPNAQTVRRHPVPRRRVGTVLVLFLVDTLLALSLGLAAGKTHLTWETLARFASSRSQPARQGAPQRPNHLRPTLTSLPPTPASTPSPISTEVWEDTFQRPNQLFWGTASDGDQWRSDAAVSRAFSIDDQAGKVTALSGAFTALLGPSLGNARLMAILSINQFNGENNMGIVLRWEDPTHWFKVYLDGESLVLMQRNGSQTLQLGSVPFQAQPRLRYGLLVQVWGSIFLAKAWLASSREPANWELGVTDQSSTWFSGFGGVRMYSQSRESVTTTVAFFRETRIP